MLIILSNEGSNIKSLNIQGTTISVISETLSPVPNSFGEILLEKLQNLQRMTQL